MLNSNLNASQRRGLKSLKDRIKKKNIVVCPTDKSWGFSVVGIETYLKMGLKHVGNYKEIGDNEIPGIKNSVMLIVQVG